MGRTRRDQLFRYPDSSIRARALELLGKPTSNAQTTAALKAFEPVTGMQGDAERGKQVFVDANCSKCHKLQGIGQHIGADLATLVDKSPAALLIALIDPNRAVEDRFLQYSALTADGLVLSGVLVEETSGHVTIADGEGKLHTILRKDIEQLVSNNISSMPEGLYEKLTLQQVADLFAFIGRTGPSPRRFAGNVPERVKSNADGSVDLPATRAAIYGPEIAFDSGSRIVTKWTSGEAYVAWSFTLPTERDMDVYVNYACFSADADKPFRLEVADQVVKGTIPSTGRWTLFFQRRMGRIHLQAGDHRRTLRSDGPINGPLLNLRAVRLVPVSPSISKKLP